MNLRVIAHLIGHMLLIVSAGIAASWGVSVYFHDPEIAQLALAVSAAITIAAGLILKIGTRGPPDLSRRDGFGVTTLGWLAASLFGALPFIFSGVIRNPVSAVFETMSGFTTTGASVLVNLEALPRGILFWRALTHFFGGMGVIVLCVAILPFLGVGGMELYRAEMPGPAKDRLTPRIASTAKLLWGVYMGLCVLQILLLKLGGMSWFHAMCHTFATIATGGFSTRSQSIGAYHSPYIEAVTIVFMFLAGTSFALHYRALRGDLLGYFRDAEFRFYLGTWLAACLLVSASVWRSVYAGAGQALRAGFFQATSVMTTTGFATADFDRWPALSRLVLVMLMFIGASAGSTGGGVKVVRVFVAIKELAREVKLFMQPQAVIPARLGRQVLDRPTVSSISTFVLQYLLLFAAASLVMCLFTPNLVTALTSVAATLGNIGPGLGAVGPVANYAAIPTAGKILLTLCMLLGRLELYTVLVLFLPSCWRK